MAPHPIKYEKTKIYRTLKVANGNPKIEKKSTHESIKYKIYCDNMIKIIIKNILKWINKSIGYNILPNVNDYTEKPVVMAH